MVERRYRRRKCRLVLSASLGTKKDENGIYHIRQDWWQNWKYVGYNDLYDLVFDAACDMSAAKFKFTSGGEEFAIWAWKGEYINLGAGAELGLYYGGGPHWKTGTDYAMPMTLQLSDTRNEVYRQKFYWAPSEKQWWITGFDPQHQDMKAKDLMAVYTIDFSERLDMYDSLKNKYSGIDGRWLFNDKKHIATLVLK